MLCSESPRPTGGKMHRALVDGSRRCLLSQAGPTQVICLFLLSAKRRPCAPDFQGLVLEDCHV